MEYGVAKVSYREFMRARRPELYSDTLHVDVGEMDRRQFEFHLQTLTSRKEETAFENFARLLAEKELCPNLVPQTGPTGGGDSKVDTETYPVAPSIATLWLEGAPTAAEERWGFAVSAKAKWKPKIRSDVEKIVSTGRPYSLIYFISNQAIKDKDRAAVEDALTIEHGIPVRILDRSWIVEKVVRNRRWDIVADALQFELTHKTVSTPGPNDVGRLRELEALDAKIDAATASSVSFEMVEESFRSALLARGLDRPRHEVDGRFDRAQRLAEKVGGSQRQRILYMKAWSALWWFDDPYEATRIYDLLESEALSSEWVWHLDDLVNLWTALQITIAPDEARTADLRAALQRHADDTSKKTSSLWARMQLLLMDLAETKHGKGDRRTILIAMHEILSQVRRLVEFPIEPIIRIVRELSQSIGDTAAYDDLLDSVIEIERERNGDRAAGELQLQRGLQKLERKKPYDAIDDLARAQVLLAQDDCRDQFIAALVGTGLAYESAGLLYAARGNLVGALDRSLYSWFKDGSVDRRALPIVKKLAWIEIQLGRVPYVLAWVKWFRPIRIALSLGEEEVKDLNDELQAIDQVLGILVLRTAQEDWAALTRLPDLFSSLGLEMSRAAALFMLGYENDVREEYSAGDDDLNQFFSQWLAAPAGLDLPEQPSWHLRSTTLVTFILGCRVEILIRGGTTSALLGESIIGFLEAFYSSALRGMKLISPRERLLIEVRQSESVKTPFSHRHVEDECGETTLIITHPVLAVADLLGEGFEGPMFDLFTRVTYELQLNIESQKFEEMFATLRAQDRAHYVARSIISLASILGDPPPGRASDWLRDESLSDFPIAREGAWVPSTVAGALAAEAAHEEGSPGDELRPEQLFGADAVRHRDMIVMSPIVLPLWDKARWKATAVALPQMPGDAVPPIMALAFEDLESGKKIFRGWLKRIGPENQDGWLSVTIITGIERSNPLAYRVVVGISESYMKAAISSNRLCAMACRMHDMTPSSSRNLDTLQDHFRRSGFVFLMPMEFKAGSSGMELTRENFDLGIRVSSLQFLPAWKVDPSSPLITAMRGITDPVLPSGMTEAPFMKHLQ